MAEKYQGDTRAGGGMMDYANTDSADRSFGAIVQDMIARGQEIARAEVRLAKAEIKEETSKAIKASTQLVAGAVVGIFALSFLLWGITEGIGATDLIPRWVAILGMGVVLGVVAFVLAQSGKKRLQSVHTVPEKTIESVKENVEWVKQQTKS